MPIALQDRARRRAIIAAFAVATLLLLIAAAQIFRTGLIIDTSLRSLAPDVSQDALSEALIEQLSAAASRKATVALAAESRADVEAASEYLRVQLAQLEDAGYNVKLTDPTETAAQYVRVLEEYPYNFLRPSLAEFLTSGDDKQLSRWVLEQLYGSAGQVRLTSFANDPFGTLNDYAVDLQTRLSGDQTDDIQSVMQDGTRRYFSAWQFDLPEDGLALNAQAQWIAQLQNIQADLHLKFSAVEWLQSGVIFFAADSASAAQRNINVISSIGIAGIVLIMLLIFRGVRPLPASVLSVLGGVLFAFCVCHSLWSSIHILTLLFGASLIGVAVDYSLHLYYFRFASPAGSENSKTHFYPALLLSLLTSIVGYSALAMSGLETLQQVAVFSIAGLSYACLLVLLFEPWAVKNLKVNDRALSTFVQSCVHCLRPVARAKYIAIGCAVIWATVLLCVPRFIFEDSPKAFVTQNPLLLDNERRLSQWLGEYEPATFILLHGANDAEVFAKIEQLLAAVSAAPEILRDAKKNLLGIHSLLSSPEQQRNNHILNGVFFDNQQLARDFIETHEILTAEQLTELRARYEQQKDKVLTPEQLLTRIPGFPRLWLEQVDSDHGKRVVTALLIPKNADMYGLRGLVNTIPAAEWISLVDETRSGLQHLRTTANVYLVFALLLICAIFIWRYGLRRGVILGVISATVIGGIALIYLVAQVPVTLFHGMAAFLVVGLGVDYLVFVAEMLEEESSLHFANALVLSGATSSLSFGLLSLSVLPAVSAFGATAMLGIIGNLIGAFCLMSVWQSFKEKQNDE
jgi:Predicted exporter